MLRWAGGWTAPRLTQVCKLAVVTPKRLVGDSAEICGSSHDVSYVCRDLSRSFPAESMLDHRTWAAAVIRTHFLRLTTPLPGTDLFVISCRDCQSASICNARCRAT